VPDVFCDVSTWAAALFFRVIRMAEEFRVPIDHPRRREAAHEAMMGGSTARLYWGRHIGQQHWPKPSLDLRERIDKKPGRAQTDNPHGLFFFAPFELAILERLFSAFEIRPSLKINICHFRIDLVHLLYVPILVIDVSVAAPPAYQFAHCRFPFCASGRCIEQQQHRPSRALIHYPLADGVGHWSASTLTAYGLRSSSGSLAKFAAIRFA
jgi:hypothetical protein